MARKSTQIQKAVSICFRGWFSCYKRKGHCSCWDLTSVLCIKECAQVTCKTGTVGCYDLAKVLATLRGAKFCLQPPGLSLTRRSTFDSILAGRIPVFFSEHSAQTQYQWYIQKDAATWSLLLGQDKAEKIEEELAKDTDRQGGETEKGGGTNDTACHICAPRFYGIGLQRWHYCSWLSESKYYLIKNKLLSAWISFINSLFLFVASFLFHIF
jgi:Exostosin family